MFRQRLKRSILLLLPLLLVSVLFGCGDADETSTSDVSSQNQIAEVLSIDEEDYVCMPYSKDGVADVVSVALSRPLWMRWANDMTEENCDNVTPGLVRDAIDCDIFKLRSNGLSMLYMDGEIYQLGESFGGAGIVTALPCDYEGDGNMDILFTFSWSAETSNTHLAVFNTQTKETHHLHAVTDSSIVALPESDEEDGVLFRVYSPVVSADQEIGTIIRVDGKLAFTALDIPVE